MDLSGTNQYAMVPAGMLASVTNFTIALWVNWDGGAAWQRIFDFGNGTTQYMFLTPDSGSGMLRFAISTNGDAPGDEQILETSPLPLGQWQHIAITRNGNTTQLYTTAFVLCQACVRCHFNKVSSFTTVMTSPSNLPGWGVPFSANTFPLASWRRQRGECRSIMAR